jgi:WD40 repeat protein
MALEHNGSFGRFTFSADERWFAAGNDDRILVWNMQDVSAGSMVLPVGSLWFFSNDGHWLFTDAGVWDMNAPSGEPIPLKDYGNLSYIDLSPDGHWLSTSDYCHVDLWNTLDFPSGPIVLHGHELRSCGGVPNGNWITSQAFSPDGHWFVTTDADSAVWLWDLQHPLTELELCRMAPG